MWLYTVSSPRAWCGSQQNCRFRALSEAALLLQNSRLRLRTSLSRPRPGAKENLFARCSPPVLIPLRNIYGRLQGQRNPSAFSFPLSPPTFFSFISCSHAPPGSLTSARPPYQNGFRPLGWGTGLCQIGEATVTPDPGCTGSATSCVRVHARPKQQDGAHENERSKPVHVCAARSIGVPPLRLLELIANLRTPLLRRRARPSSLRTGPR